MIDKEWVMEPFDKELYGNVGHVIRTERGQRFALASLDLHENSDEEHIVEEAVTRHAVACVNAVAGLPLEEVHEALDFWEITKKLRERTRAVRKEIREGRIVIPPKTSAQEDAEHSIRCTMALDGWDLSEAEDVLKRAKKLKKLAHVYAQTSSGARVANYELPLRGTGDPL